MVGEGTHMGSILRLLVSTDEPVIYRMAQSLLTKILLDTGLFDGTHTHASHVRSSLIGFPPIVLLMGADELRWLEVYRL